MSGVGMILLLALGIPAGIALAIPGGVLTVIARGKSENVLKEQQQLIDQLSTYL